MVFINVKNNPRDTRRDKRRRKEIINKIFLKM
jgi:hypothetical protein